MAQGMPVDGRSRRSRFSIENNQLATCILRTNRIMRAVYLPTGRHRIVFSYRPTVFYVGTVLSVVGWLALAIACMFWMRRRGTPRSSGSA